MVALFLSLFLSYFRLHLTLIKSQGLPRTLIKIIINSNFQCELRHYLQIIDIDTHSWKLDWHLKNRICTSDVS